MSLGMNLILSSNLRGLDSSLDLFMYFLATWGIFRAGWSQKQSEALEAPGTVGVWASLSAKWQTLNWSRPSPSRTTFIILWKLKGTSEDMVIVQICALPNSRASSSTRKGMGQKKTILFYFCRITLILFRISCSLCFYVLRTSCWLLLLLVKMQKKISTTAGFEPTIFGAENRRVNHYATRPWAVSERTRNLHSVCPRFWREWIVCPSSARTTFFKKVKMEKLILFKVRNKAFEGNQPTWTVVWLSILTFFADPSDKWTWMISLINTDGSMIQLY